jgi:outer membrane lipoprotein LolB
VALAHQQESWHASIHWQQAPAEWQVRLTAPLGQGSVIMRGSDEMVILEGRDGVSHVASSAEALLERHLGWAIPVEGLRYWVRGLAAPGGEATIERAQGGGVATLTQHGWRIDYRRWTEVGPLRLPEKIFLQSTGRELSVRLVIDQWQTGQSAEPMQ